MQKVHEQRERETHQRHKHLAQVIEYELGRFLDKIEISL
jgi:hypothetical protein